MKFEKHFPVERLKPYVKHFVVSESEIESEYKVFPSSGLVIGFQYKAQLAATTDKQRIKIVEQFLISQLKDIQTDKLIVEAVRLIYQSKGTIRIKELNEKLFISQSPLEKRFRKVVGTTPKKFASIVRFSTVLDSLDHAKSLTEICYENGFFDQAHFIKDFKQFTGETPDNFKRFL